MTTTTTRGTCKTCGGKGYLIRARQIGRGQFVREDETCPTCHGDGGPRPYPPCPLPVEGGDSPPAGRLEVAGHTVTAPGFTADSFDRAIYRAHNDGLTISPTDRGDMVLVSNPINGASYTVSRHSCSCTAGRSGVGCKHRALAIMFADILHTLPTPATVPTRVAA